MADTSQQLCTLNFLSLRGTTQDHHHHHYYYFTTGVLHLHGLQVFMQVLI